MSLFGNKKNKNESFRTLSETEIQKKLYGGVLPGGRVAQKTSSEEVTPSQDTAPDAQTTAPPMTQPNQNAFKPENSEGDEAPDLFSHSENETEESGEISEMPAPPREKIQQWVRQENEALEQTQKKPPHTPSVYRPKQAEASDEGANVQVVQGVGKALRVFFHTLLSFFGVILGGIIGILLKVDFRKPHIRKMVYWLGAVGLLGGLLIAIHFLNVKREKAMNDAAAAISAPPTDSGQAQQAKTKKVLSLVEIVTVPQPAKEKKVQAIVPPVVVTNAGSSGSNAVDTAVTTAAPKKSYVVQVATYAIEADAERVVERFRNVNIASFVRSLERPSGKLYYCVFLGTFPNYQSAESALTEFKKTDSAKPFQDSFVRRI